jgi:hypothetical protein
MLKEKVLQHRSDIGQSMFEYTLWVLPMLLDWRKYNGTFPQICSTQIGTRKLQFIEQQEF